MNFCINKLILWLENGKKRELTFHNNKINVITGGSNTGKSAILDIVDYCFMSSKHRISENIINENILWYGIKCTSENETFIIARKKPIYDNVSNDYYFDSLGNEPELPSVNISKYTLNDFINKKLGINCDVKMPYGGKEIRAGSKISFRYFLMFNTISQDVIDKSSTFFDNQDIERYREALPRIFDLAVGIDTIYNILHKEQRDLFEVELKKLEKKKDIYNKKKLEFIDELNDVIRQAKEYNLIDENLYNDKAIEALKESVSNIDTHLFNNQNVKYINLSNKILEIKKKIRNIELFIEEYDKYKVNLNEIIDSLKPIEFLAEKDAEIIKTSIFDDLIAVYKNDLQYIKKSISKKTPISIDTYNLLDNHKKELERCQKEIDELPENVKFFRSDISKYIFIGQIKSKIDLYLTRAETSDNKVNEDIKRKSELLEAITIKDTSQSMEKFIKNINIMIKKYMNSIKESLENYQDYLPSFEYFDKKLVLQNPYTLKNEYVGSSSNHMFLHLLLFTALHEYIISSNASFVPSFLIIDQFSRPYWDNDKTKSSKELPHTDIAKVKNAVKLLSYFIDNIKNLNKSFQILLFEHIEPELFEQDNNYHLVEEFTNGNALIRNEDRA